MEEKTRTLNDVQEVQLDYWDLQKCTKKMQAIIIKEIIEENFPELRDGDFQIEVSLKLQGI